MPKAIRRHQPHAAPGQGAASVREFLQRTTPASDQESVEAIATPPVIMCHVFLLSCVLERTANREAEQHGLTLPQWMALGCIGHEGKAGITHSDLCQRLMLSKAPVTGIVDRLVRDGYAVRTTDSQDRRVSRIVIKPKGETAWRRVRDSMREHAFTHCRGFSEEEQKTLLSLLARLLDEVAESERASAQQT